MVSIVWYSCLFVILWRHFKMLKEWWSLWRPSGFTRWKNNLTVNLTMRLYTTNSLHISERVWHHVWNTYINLYQNSLYKYMIWYFLLMFWFRSNLMCLFDDATSVGIQISFLGKIYILKYVSTVKDWFGLVWWWSWRWRFMLMDFCIYFPSQWKTDNSAKLIVLADESLALAICDMSGMDLLW